MLVFIRISPLSAAVMGRLMRNMTIGQLFAGNGALPVGIAFSRLSDFAYPHGLWRAVIFQWYRESDTYSVIRKTCDDFLCCNLFSNA